MSAGLLRRLFHLTRAQVGSPSPPPSRGEDPGPGRPDPAPNDELAGYYAKLEIPCGSDRETVRAAWKGMMRKYHPDLHGADPEKRRLAGELTANLTRAYQELAAVLEPKGRRGQSRANQTQEGP